ncbi:MAG: alpha/beta hydrolase-fold protein [Myxococcota bacterium]
MFLALTLGCGDNETSPPQGETSGSGGSTSASAAETSSGRPPSGSNSAALDTGSEGSSTSGPPPDGESSSSTGDPGGPTSMFCQCSTDNPAPDAGSFQMCAEQLADGSGTYYEPPPYMRTADAETVPGVPTGVVTQGMFSGSAVYPETTWDYWVYVPAQYDGAEPSALLVLTDGEVYRRNGNGASYRTPTVLDNLIDQGAMPVTIAVFVDPGQSNGQSTRSLEYNTPDANYVTFLLDELLPEALAGYSVTADPHRRAIGGRSSGGAAAFTAGWERPDAFGLIYTTLGSFVQLRANDRGEYADRYPPLIESEAPRPLRVTLLSGTNDLDNQFGNWRDAHMAMTTALDCAGYTYRSGFGESEHGDGSHPRDEFGDDLRWLFADTVD